MDAQHGPLHRRPDEGPWRGTGEPRDAGRVLSPGGWVVPEGRLAAWDWLPPSGAVPRVDLAPWWLRWWYRTPLVDRWAHACMWRRGCWEVAPPPREGWADSAARLPVRPPAPALPAEAGRDAQGAPAAGLRS